MNANQMIPLCLLVWFTLAVAPTFAQTITYVPISAAVSFDGDLTGEEFFGSSVSDAGDVNGDGFADLIVGAPGDNDNGIDGGNARVLTAACSTVSMGIQLVTGLAA